MPVEAIVPIVICLMLLAFVVFVALRFPDEFKSLLRRLEGVSVSTEGLAVTFVAAAVEQREQRTPPKRELEASLAGFPAGRILWVDDVPTNNVLETRALRELGVTVDVATTNAEAVARVGTERPYDLVLSDIGRRAPEGKEAGLELPRALRAAGCDAPVVYYVGRVDEPTTDGGEPVLNKPTALFAAIRERLAGEA